MLKKIILILLPTVLFSPIASAAPGDYDPAYDQGGGYGAATLDERVVKLEKKLSGDSQIELLNRVEQLQKDVLRLRGEVEDLTHRLDSAKRQHKEQYLDLDRRVLALTPVPPPAAEQPAASMEAVTQGQQDPNAQPPVNPLPTQQPQGIVQTPTNTPPSVATPPTPAPVPAVPTPPVQPTPVFPTQTSNPARPPEPPKQPAPTYAVQTKVQPTAAPSADSEARQAAYLKAFNVFKDRKYADAAKEFKSFLNTYPKGAYSDTATYWLAKSQYFNHDLSAANEAFSKFVKEHPQDTKVPDAQLMLGNIDYETGQWASARESLNEVVKRYHDTSAAKSAQQRLDKMTQEGH